MITGASIRGAGQPTGHPKRVALADMTAQRFTFTATYLGCTTIPIPFLSLAIRGVCIQVARILRVVRVLWAVRVAQGLWFVRGVRAVAATVGVVAIWGSAFTVSSAACATTTG